MANQGIGDIIEFTMSDLDKWKSFVPELFKYGATRGIIMMLEEAGEMMHITLETILYRNVSGDVLGKPLVANLLHRYSHIIRSLPLIDFVRRSLTIV